MEQAMENKDLREKDTHAKDHEVNASMKIREAAEGGLLTRIKIIELLND